MDELPPIIVGVDNGSTGSIAFLYPDLTARWFKTPVKKVRNYQKKEKTLNRVDTVKLKELLQTNAVSVGGPIHVVLERPYCNPLGFNSSLLAARALEATLIVLDDLNLTYVFVDSRSWQNYILPKGIAGTDDLKKESLKLGREKYPNIKFKKDADSLLMALWAREVELWQKTSATAEE